MKAYAIKGPDENIRRLSLTGDMTLIEAKLNCTCISVEVTERTQIDEQGRPMTYWGGMKDQREPAARGQSETTPATQPTLPGSHPQRTDSRTNCATEGGLEHQPPEAEKSVHQQEPAMTDFQLAAQWTPDCQGKQDYDGEIVVLSTRYWPRGGGFSVIQNGHFSTNADKELRPSAHATIGICLLDTDIYRLTDAEFEDDTEAKVKEKVEAWAKEQFDRLIACVLKEFKP